MSNLRTSVFIVLLFLLAGSTAALSSTLEVDYVTNSPNWCPGAGCTGGNVQALHASWHDAFGGSREFLEFHREFLAQSDDFRLYGADTDGADPDPAIFAVVPNPGALLEFQHTSTTTNGFARPALHQVDALPAAHTDPGGVRQLWPVRPAILTMGDPEFCGFSVDELGSIVDGLFHGDGHITIATHDLSSPSLGIGEMGSVATAPRDGAFFQWHKYIDLIYSDWAVSQYQTCDKSGTPIYFSVGTAAVGSAGSSLKERRGADVYQGNISVDPATQYGAAPRIASDIYVGDSDASNLLYAPGVRQWSAVPTANAWDVDAWSILNPAGSGWYFSVTMASSGAPATAVNAEAVKGGDVFASAGGGINGLYRAESALGLSAAATDELEALEIDQQRRVQGTNDGNAAGVHDRPKQYFSLRSGSTLGVQSTTGTTIGPSDILRFGPKGQLEIAVSGSVLGLGAGDDLDALAIVDADSSDTLTGSDRIYHSLAAGSPSLGADSAADVFCYTAAGATCGALGGRLEQTAAGLGLLAADDLDGLDVGEGAPATTGACCLPSGGCSDSTPAACFGIGSFAGVGTVCAATTCPSAPGACCSSSGTCSSVSDQQCLGSDGVFLGAGIPCNESSCPFAENDDCANAYDIPYDRPAYYEPPADNTYAFSDDTDPQYTCADHEVFFPPYGSGTIWYSYDVPDVDGPHRSLYLDTDQTAPYYPFGGGAGDTRIAIYYSPTGDCSNLQEVACGDNSPGPYTSANYYAAVGYNDPAPGRYYVQVSTVGDANRGVIRLAVTDSFAAGVPSLGAWGSITLVTLLVFSSGYLLRRRTWTAAALVVLCAGGLFFTTGAIWSERPAPPASVRSLGAWPGESRLARSPEHPTLVMFADPDCPCTRAGLKELRELMSRLAGKARGYVLVERGAKDAEEPSLTDNWIAASSIPGVKALPDLGAREAERFGATISGQVMLFDPFGQRLFTGGIAPARGQKGENPMARALADAIEAAVAGRTEIARVQMPNGVRGCALGSSRK